MCASNLFKMNLKESLAEKYKAELERQKQMKANPHSASSKANTRRGGIALIILGLITAGINYYTWTTDGFMLKGLLACAIAFLGLGLYALLTGKMPNLKR